ncbi:MAG TPA: hypothetical protein VGK12_03935 [Actinomycetota bacterium]|jgi:hypothetical protein
MLAALGFVWSLPNTLIGLVLGGLSFVRPRIAQGVLVFDGPPRGITWLLARMRRSAMTVGFVIVSNAPVEGALLAHERAHVRQSMVLGPLFIPAYLVLAVPFGYRRHPMERAARRAAGEPD